MLFDILSSVAYAAKEKVVDTVVETKENYDKYYEQFSEKTQYWDDDRMRREYAKLASGSDYAKKAAMLKLMQERGLLKK